MVPAPRERVGGGALRQRVVDRRARSRRSSCSGVYQATGSWRPAFIVTGVLGLLWISRSDGCIARRRSIRAVRPRSARTSSRTARRRRPRSADRRRKATLHSYHTLLRLPQTWGIMIGKGLTDPVWFFITDWFAIYLVSRGFRARRQPACAFWVPFLAADLGNFSGGGVVEPLIGAAGGRRGAQDGRRRGSLGMPFLIAGRSTRRRCWRSTTCFAVATCSYAAISTMILNLPADCFRRARSRRSAGHGRHGSGHRHDRRDAS